MNEIDIAVEILEDGGVVGLPTDTVYGLAADPSDRRGVERLYELKGRPDDKPISFLVPSLPSVSGMFAVSSAAADLAERHWPGALTLVLRAIVDLPEWVGDRGLTVGVRMPSGEPVTELLQRTGPLAVTSANLSGYPPALDDTTARPVFGDGVDLYLAGVSGGGVASTVVDCTGATPVVLRPGPILLD